MEQKRFYVLQANSLNKEDIKVLDYNSARYNKIAIVRKAKEFRGQKTLKVTTLWGAYYMRITYFQNRSFYIKIQREVCFLNKVPNIKQEPSKLYARIIDEKASKRFLKYMNTLPKEIKNIKVKTSLEQLRVQMG